MAGTKRIGRVLRSRIASVGCELAARLIALAIGAVVGTNAFEMARAVERAVTLAQTSPAPITDPLPENQKPWWPSRYGQDDQIGTLNEIDPQATIAAARLVRTGKVVDLGRAVDGNTPVFPGRFWKQTVDVSPHFSNPRRSDAVGGGWGRNEINWITELQVGTFQGGTQLDSIGHVQIRDRFYNAWTTGQVVDAWGLNRVAIETVPPIVTRGVLVDIAAHKGVERLARGYVITVADVEGALARQGIDIR